MGSNHGKTKQLNIRVGCPNVIERVENNLLSYGMR